MFPPLAATSAQVPGGPEELLGMGTAGAAVLENGSRGNVSRCEGWERAGQGKGQLPSSKRGPDQDKQHTAGREDRVPRQSLKKETGIVGTWWVGGPQLEARAALFQIAWEAHLP